MTRIRGRPDARSESAVLAVWAWRRADELGVRASRSHFAVGGTSGGVAVAAPDAGAASPPSSALSATRPTTSEADDNVAAVPDAPEGISALGSTDSAPAQATDLAAEILLTGVAHLGAGFDQRVAAVTRALDAAGLRWPLLAVADLADQLDAYTARAARSRPEYVAELLTELAARHRASGFAATSPFAGGEPRARVLGTEEAAEVRLRRVRLGCRVRAIGQERSVQIFLADFANGAILTLNQHWTQEPDTTTGHVLRARRLAGTTIGALASGNIVTEAAVLLSGDGGRVLSLSGLGLRPQSATFPIKSSNRAAASLPVSRSVRCTAAAPERRARMSSWSPVSAAGAV